VTSRLLLPLGVGGLLGLVLGTGACGGPAPAERLCDRYCEGKEQAVPAEGATSCAPSGNFRKECTEACEEDLDSVRATCRTELLLAYACGADHTWFCIPKEGGGRVYTQFDTCRDLWDTLYTCEKAGTDGGVP